VAFNPKITNPQEAQKKAGESNENNPLDVSGANLDISQSTSEEASGAGKKIGKEHGSNNMADNPRFPCPYSRPPAS
jgi:hypothetical protein